jgi:MinD superfamily P-loop ATPase
MIISVASGKGGTGKTTVASSLVTVWDRPVTAVDLDVEEPNLHLFLQPKLDRRETVYMEIPVIDESKCTLCRKCSDLCQYKAVTILGETILTFPEMCHGCGGCLAVCPEGAVSSGTRELGVLEQGLTGRIPFLMGRLRIGEAMSPPLMRVVKLRLNDLLREQPGDAIIDAPPGVSCPAVSAVIDSDYIVLVTEPTPFGFYDFKLAWQAFLPLGKPMGVVINRAGLGDDSVQTFCREKGLQVLAEIPYTRAIAEGYARGRVVADLSAALRQTFESIRDALQAGSYKKEPVHA